MKIPKDTIHLLTKEVSWVPDGQGNIEITYKGDVITVPLAAFESTDLKEFNEEVLEYVEMFKH